MRLELINERLNARGFRANGLNLMNKVDKSFDLLDTINMDNRYKRLVSTSNSSTSTLSTPRFINQ